MSAPAKLRNNRLRRVVPVLLREIQNMGGLQQQAILRPLMRPGVPARLVEAKAAELVNKRHARRKARLAQKASRKRNRA